MGGPQSKPAAAAAADGRKRGRGEEKRRVSYRETLALLWGEGRREGGRKGELRGREGLTFGVHN